MNTTRVCRYCMVFFLCFSILVFYIITLFYSIFVLVIYYLHASSLYIINVLNITCAILMLYDTILARA